MEKEARGSGEVEGEREWRGGQRAREGRKRRGRGRARGKVMVREARRVRAIEAREGPICCAVVLLCCLHLHFVLVRLVNNWM